MNKQIERLIEAIADNEIQRAREIILQIGSTDKAVCNRGFWNFVKSKIENSIEMVKLPSNIEGLVTIEDTSKLFEKDRYVETYKDKEILKQVSDIYKVNEKLIEYGIDYINSLLLYGESGCGKTMFGKYMAYKFKLPFVYMNFSKIISSYLGNTSKNISDVFNYMQGVKCVFMIDEIDAIGTERTYKNGGCDNEMARTVITLMQCLDKLKTGTILVGATNKINDIDKALRRRFSIHYEIKLPDSLTRQEIAKKYMQSIPNSEYSDSDLLEFADETEGFSCAKITNLIVNRIVNHLVKNEKVTLKGM